MKSRLACALLAALLLLAGCAKGGARYLAESVPNAAPVPGGAYGGSYDYDATAMNTAMQLTGGEFLYAEEAEFAGVSQRRFGRYRAAR